MNRKDEQIVAAARTVALSAETWADLSNALFDAEEGLVAKAYPTRAEREQFLQTDAYKALQQLLDTAEERTGLVEGATPKKSGKFIVRLPRSLHAALHAEAAAEGVSLNQLVVTKLAIQMSHLTSVTHKD
jgi:predicted HicB family RNase H-like nuclease